jgi:hypothetical protein
VAEQVLFIALLGGIDNPYAAPLDNITFTKNYLAWRASTAAKRLRGVPYQIHGPTHRGAARPELEEGAGSATPGAPE